MMSPSRASVRLPVRVLMAALLIALLASCRPMNSSESHLFGQTNALRERSGLAELQQHPELVDEARAWARHLAARGALAHSDPHQWQVSWQAVAENVGTAGSIETVFQSLVASPSHRANMLSSKYTHMATGTARGKDGRVYAVQLFWRG
jgi:uncharacterized protein YkwD